MLDDRPTEGIHIDEKDLRENTEHYTRVMLGYLSFVEIPIEGVLFQISPEDLIKIRQSEFWRPQGRVFGFDMRDPAKAFITLGTFEGEGASLMPTAALSILDEGWQLFNIMDDEVRDAAVIVGSHCLLPQALLEEYGFRIPMSLAQQHEQQARFVEAYAEYNGPV